MLEFSVQSWYIIISTLYCSKLLCRCRFLMRLNQQHIVVVVYCRHSPHVVGCRRLFNHNTTKIHFVTVAQKLRHVGEFLDLCRLQSIEAKSFFRTPPAVKNSQETPMFLSVLFAFRLFPCFLSSSHLIRDSNYLNA